MSFRRNVLPNALSARWRIYRRHASQPVLLPDRISLELCSLQEWSLDLAQQWSLDLAQQWSLTCSTMVHGTRSTMVLGPRSKHGPEQESIRLTAVSYICLLPRVESLLLCTLFQYQSLSHPFPSQDNQSNTFSLNKYVCTS